MKVKELIKFLADFNPNSSVRIVDAKIGRVHQITDCGWAGNEVVRKGLIIATQVYFSVTILKM